ncbi:2-hydroxyacid dehydrogenase [Micromonospora zhanjiangensis]|uniref:2-hydroxyacid dehydrogenase n=1 Tax=Micromonospora zhanjiangensis TaxID=1522057 RepID=A0ABV8KVT8_9ACTN
MASLEARLRSRFAAVRLPDAPDTDSFLNQRGKEFVAAVTSGRVGVSDQLMDALPNLKAIINFGVGYDTTNIDSVRSRGLILSNTPDVLTDCVADTAVGALIDVMRSLSAADRYIRRGDWLAKGNFPLTRRVSGTTVGILGLGRIGLAIAHRLAGFNIHVAYHNRNRRADVPYPYVDSVIALAARSDILIVAASGGDSSRGLISAEVLDALGPDGFLVNVARGSIVNEAALVDSLAHHRIAGAGLDTFVNEPHVPAELLSLDNVVVLPHVGSGTQETREAMAELVLQNLFQFLADGTLVTPVTSP